jgi:hypothetical protein
MHADPKQRGDFSKLITGSKIFAFAKLVADSAWGR